MDYIQQAIDKAREERQGNIGQSDSTDKPVTSNEPSKEQVDSKKGVPDSINYTKTRQTQISNQQLKDNRVIAGFSFEPAAEPYRQLRTQVLQKMRANDWKTLAITSPNENAGKSLTALNLAIALSQEVNQTVLLVDLDLRNPSILNLLSIEAEKGIVDHLRDEVSVSEILINPGFDRLVILPGVADPNYSSEILSSPAMKELLEDLTSRYGSRIIIFDLPALLVNDDALVFTPFVDSALLVVEDGVSTEEDIQKSLMLLEGVNLMGSILNKAD